MCTNIMQIQQHFFTNIKKAKTNNIHECLKKENIYFSISVQNA